MEEITITIQTENAAFEEAGPECEVGRILAKLAKDLQNGMVSGYKILLDANGNRVGQYDATS